MPRGLHLNNVHVGSEDRTCPSPEPHLGSSPSTASTSNLANTLRKRRAKFDPTRVIDVRIGTKNRLLPSTECSRRCTFYFSQRNDEEGVCWKKVTKTTKAFYWGEFKKYIKHPQYSEKDIFNAWKKKAAVRYKDWINQMSKLETKPANGINQRTWDAWTKYWKTEEFQKKSNRGKKNRDRNGKGMVNHTGGSQTFEVHLERMRENGEDPDPPEFHRRTHTRKCNDEIVFCDDHARQVNADYLAKENEALLQLQSQAEANGSVVPTELPRSDKVALFKEVAGGEKKGEVYGSGSASSELYSLESGVSSSSPMASLSSATEVLELRRQVLHLEEALAREREERNNLIADAELRMYNVVKKMMRSRRNRRQQDEDDVEDDNTDIEG